MDVKDVEKYLKTFRVNEEDGIAITEIHKYIEMIKEDFGSYNKTGDINFLEGVRSIINGPIEYLIERINEDDPAVGVFKEEFVILIEKYIEKLNTLTELHMIDEMY